MSEDFLGGGELRYSLVVLVSDRNRWLPPKYLLKNKIDEFFWVISIWLDGQALTLSSLHLLAILLDIQYNRYLFFINK
jgi:hypothetical protein